MLQDLSGISPSEGWSLTRAWEIVILKPGMTTQEIPMFTRAFYDPPLQSRGACARRKTVNLIGLKYTQFLLAVTINHNKDCHKNVMCVNSFIWKSIVRCLTKTWLISTMQIWRTYLLNRISVKYQWCVKSQDGQFIFCIFSVIIGILQNKICISRVYSVLRFVCIRAAKCYHVMFVWEEDKAISTREPGRGNVTYWC